MGFGPASAWFGGILAGDGLVQAGHHAARAIRASARRRMRVPAMSGGEGARTVYFLAPDHREPAGGAMVMYRHVEILNAAGVRAVAVHQRPGFRYDWFESSAAVLSISEVAVGRSDLLVIGELDVDLIARLARPPRHVILNQSGYLTWHTGAEIVSRHYREAEELVGVLAISSNVQRIVEQAFPGIFVRRVRPGIDPGIFHAARGSVRPHAIASMARRNSREARVVAEILKGSALPAEWRVVSLGDLRHEEMGEAFRAARVYLSLSVHEGFGLPAAEAMACGTYVVGFHGYGGREFFRPEFCTIVETGDLVGVAKAVLGVLEADCKEPGWLLNRGLEASAFIHRNYSLEMEAADVVKTYSEVLDRG